MVLKCAWSIFFLEIIWYIVSEDENGSVENKGREGWHACFNPPLYLRENSFCHSWENMLQSEENAEKTKHVAIAWQ